MKKVLTLKTLVAMTFADVDIFLLKESDQETDKNKTFTVEEIRNQLMASAQKTVSVLRDMNVAIDEPIVKNDFIKN